MEDLAIKSIYIPYPHPPLNPPPALSGWGGGGSVSNWRDLRDGDQGRGKIQGAGANPNVRREGLPMAQSGGAWGLTWLIQIC